MSETVASRIKPVLGVDNAWWWEMAADGKLGIQRCLDCKVLRHPPTPMCDKCHSLQWDTLESCGRGVINTYTILTYPKFPGYSYPLIIILVDLEEGTRLTSQLVDCSPEDVDFNLAVQMSMHKDADGFTLPVFRLAGD